MPPSRHASDAKIAAATLELLRTKGPSAVTVEGVAAHSGVARTTVYRRYADRAAMLTDVLQRLAAENAVDEHDCSGEGRLRWVVERASAMILDGIGFGGFAALLTDADPAFTDAFRTVLQTHRRLLADELRAGVADGVLTLRGDIETLVDSIVGALLAEYGRTGAIADDWSDRLVALHSDVLAERP
ncbi:TetR/AcrR family transcriptional regulator [Gordonia hydrophobica]|uniref:Helix-turn-helix domain-containing protein n=1 Tax=Gordonia hydrophobica TaxID=40516 RepID=A0ABZ2U531_9ACTN|nr:helix-turn-helix domain-containing protein [Gordonia hydrophobica]MBM7368193.1 AcrR family transcriptional regulator [Gordonia hydrophobica]